jgi:hypothetical protein
MFVHPLKGYRARVAAITYVSSGLKRFYMAQIAAKGIVAQWQGSAAKVG